MWKIASPAAESVPSAQRLQQNQEHANYNYTNAAAAPQYTSSSNALRTPATTSSAVAAAAAGPAANSSLPARMLDLISETVEKRDDPKALSMRLAQHSVSVPERNVWLLWNRMLEDFEMSPAFLPELVGVEQVPAIRRWYVSHATFIQHLMTKCPRIRRMTIALKWLEDTFETPAVADSVVPFVAGGKYPIDPDLQRKIFLQLRGGRWSQAAMLAEEGSAHVSHILDAALMVAPVMSSSCEWLNKMPRAALFGEYEVQTQNATTGSNGAGRPPPQRNPHRLPLMLRMLEHLRNAGADSGSAASRVGRDGAATNDNGGSIFEDGDDGATSSTTAAITAAERDAQLLNSNNESDNNNNRRRLKNLSSGSFDYFNGIAAIICGDERAMKDACRAHFGSSSAAASSTPSFSSTPWMHQNDNGSPTAASSWQDELWALLRSHLVAAFTVAILKGACGSSSSSVSSKPSSNTSNNTTLIADQFEGIFSGESIESFVSTLESRCGLTGGLETVSLDDGCYDWFRSIEANTGNAIIARLRGLSTRFPVDSVDGIALQSLTLFLSDIGRDRSLLALPGISNKVSPLRDTVIAPTMTTVNTTASSSSGGGGVVASPTAATSGGSHGKLNGGQCFLRWCLPEQASLTCLASLAYKKGLLPTDSQTSPTHTEIICAMIVECLCDPTFEINQFLPRLMHVAMYSSLTSGEPARRIQTHSAVFKSIRIRFVGDVGNFIGLETNSAEGMMAKFLREADQQIHGNTNAVDMALKAVANRLRDDPSVPMLTHDTRCESVLWKSFMSDEHRTTVVAEAVQALRDLWNDNRNVSAMQDICDIWERRLTEGLDEAVDSSSNSALSPTRRAGSPNPRDLIATAREQILFWSAVLKCHELANAIGAETSQLLQQHHQSGGGGGGRHHQPQQRQQQLESRKHDLCVTAMQMTDVLAQNCDTATELCPKYGATAVAACVELLSEAIRTLLPFVDSASMTRLFHLAFAQLPKLDRCHIFGAGSSLSSANTAGSQGVELLPSQNAASLMRSLQALRIAYVSQLQRREAERIRSEAVASSSF